MSIEIDMEQLKAEVEEKMREMLGEELADENLSEYVMACIAKRCDRDYLQTSLAEVLALCCDEAEAEDLSKELCDWVFDKLERPASVQSPPQSTCLLRQAEQTQPASPDLEDQTLKDSDEQDEEPAPNRRARVREPIVYNIGAAPVKSSKTGNEKVVLKKQGSSQAPAGLSAARPETVPAEVSRKKPRSRSPNATKSVKTRHDPSTNTLHSRVSSGPKGPVAGLFKAALRATVSADSGQRDQNGGKHHSRSNSAHHPQPEFFNDRVRSHGTAETSKGGVFTRLSRVQDSASPHRVDVGQQSPAPGGVKTDARPKIEFKLPEQPQKVSSTVLNREAAAPRVEMEASLLQTSGIAPGTDSALAVPVARSSVFNRLAGGVLNKFSEPFNAAAPVVKLERAEDAVSLLPSTSQSASAAKFATSPSQLVGGKRRVPELSGVPGIPIQQEPGHESNAWNISYKHKGDSASIPDQRANGHAGTSHSTGAKHALKRASSLIEEAPTAKRAAVSWVDTQPGVPTPRMDMPKPVTNGVVQRNVAVSAINVPMDEAAEMKRRMEQLQREIQQLKATKLVPPAFTKAAPAVPKAAPVVSKAAPVGSKSQPTPAFAPSSATMAPTVPTAGNKSVMVTNVHFDATREVVSAHFTFCGLVRSVNIATDAFGQPRGYAFVEFEDASAVAQAMSLSGSILLGRQIKVVMAQPSAPKPTVAAKPAVFKQPPMHLSASNPFLPPGFGGVSEQPSTYNLKPNLAALAAAQPLPSSNVWVRPRGTV